MSKYFHDLEFLACTPSCNISQMDKRFLDILDKLRQSCGFPLVLSCAFRSEKWDIDRGRSGNSLHTKGKAVDIKCLDAHQRAILVYNALRLGLSVGVYSSFIHVDCRSSGLVLFHG